MLVTFLVITLLQLSRLSWTLSLGICIFTPSECPGVIEIVLLFHFSIHHLERTTRPSQGIPSSMIVSRKAEILLCCYVRLPVAFLWMWEWIMTDLSSLGCGRLKELWSSAVSIISEFDPFCHWSQTGRSGRLCSTGIWISPSLSTLHTPLLSCPCIVALSSPSLTFALFPSLFTSLLSSSLSLYPPAQPLWVSGSQRKCFILLETCHWPWYDGSGNKSIVGASVEYLHPFTNHFWQGIHNRSRRGAAGSRIDGGLTAQMKQPGAGDRRATLHLPRVRAPPHSPQRPPL